MPAGQTWRDIVDGLQFIRSNSLVRGVMIGLAGGLLGGGSIVPLGAVFAKEVLGADPSAFGFLTTALRHRRRARCRDAACGCSAACRGEAVFTSAVVATGVAIIVVGVVSTLALAILAVGVVGAGAGCAYVTGFTLLQESVTDEMRGRMFATLYTVVRVCLLLSLTIGPFVAAGLGALSDHLTNGEVAIGSAHSRLPACGSRCGSAARSPCSRASRRAGGCARSPLPAERERLVTFIVLEGGEGSGKSTQVERLAAVAARRRAAKSSSTFEPGDTKVGARDPRSCCCTATRRSIRAPSCC